jgi:hypothetical protein
MKTKDVALYRAMQLPDEMNKENQSQQQDEEQEELGEE